MPVTADVIANHRGAHVYMRKTRSAALVAGLIATTMTFGSVAYANTSVGSAPSVQLAGMHYTPTLAILRCSADCAGWIGAVAGVVSAAAAVVTLVDSSSSSSSSSGSVHFARLTPVQVAHAQAIYDQKMANDLDQ